MAPTTANKKKPAKRPRLEDLPERVQPVLDAVHRCDALAGRTAGQRAAGRGGR